MKPNRLAALLLVMLALGTAVSAGSGTRAKAAAAKPTPAALLAQGRYLVTIMACNDCHTPGTFYGAPDASRFLAGSEMGWGGPWGVAYAANLTPDAETGLGKWTEAQIAKALRTGNRPDGRQLAAIMPWQDFAALSDHDALAIAAYLKSLPPVKHAVPKPVEPGQPVQGPVAVFPAPSAWDAPRTPPSATEKK